jgi:hypothetical protein
MNRSNAQRWILLFAIVCAPMSSHAIDAWDAATVRDNTAATTNNEMTFGTTQTHDLQAIGGVADEDWIIVFVEAFRNYEISVSQVTGGVDMSQADFLERWDATGATKLQSQAGTTTMRLMRWNPTVTEYQRIRIKGLSSTGAGSEYTISFSMSALFCPRYNNSGSQISVLIVQNTTTGSCAYNADFFDEAGNYLDSATPPTVPPMGTSVVPAGSVPAVVGTKGSVRINHSCSPSAIKSKIVALEPATGFSFDTLCERR